MIIILILIPLSLLFAGAFLGAFFWAVRNGQYEDTCTPAMRVLVEDTPTKTATTTSAAISTNQPGH